MQQSEKKGGGTSKVWVLVVLIVGVVLGLVLSTIQSTTSTPWRGHGRGGWGLSLETADDIDVLIYAG